MYKWIASRKKTIPPVPREVWRNPLYFIAFGFGSGALPVAPGTFGTIVAIPCYLLLSQLPANAYLIFTVAFIIFSSWLCDYISNRTNTNDHPGMCIDEFAGFFVTMLYAPAGWAWVLLGFILFRIFDILKPWPISYVDKNIHGGFGMVLDDVMAGALSCLIIQLLAMLI